MIPKMNRQKNVAPSKFLIVVIFGMAFCIGALPADAQQNQPDRPGFSPVQQPSDAQPQGQPSQQVLPQSLTVPAGTIIRVRIDDWLSTDRNATGDNFSAVLDQPIVVNGWVVARRGQAQTGRVSIVKKGGHGKGASQLGVDLPELTLVDGQQLPLQTELFQTSAGSWHERDAAVIGTTTGMGAVIGGIAGGGTGAAIGAGIGVTAGIIGVISTNGKPTVIAPETVFSFRLQAPVTLSTENSQYAFQPVSQSDYDSHTSQGRPHMDRPSPPRPPYPYYPYAYGYPYAYDWYSGPFIGFGYYGGYGRGYGRFGGYRR